MDLTEAEIQVLASICKAEIDATPTDRVSIESIGECYAAYKENWDEAFNSLAAKELVENREHNYCLTDIGRPIGELYRGERNDMYWYYYQKFYSAAYASEAHSRFCEKVFGKDLCQEGQTDMASLNHLLKCLDLKDNETLLDLGCGAGVISEYISDKTGALVTGVDYAIAAIAEANRRTTQKKSRLNFIQGNFNELVLAPDSYDAVISIDTLYWDDGLEKTLSMLATALKPGGRMGIFLNHFINEGDSPELLNVDYSVLSRALVAVGLSFETYDYTKQLGEFWCRLRDATYDLREAFESEGNGFIVENYLREAEDDHLLEINAGTVARYLYLVRNNR